MRPISIVLFATAAQAAIAGSEKGGNLPERCHTYGVFENCVYSGYVVWALCEHPEERVEMELDKCVGNVDGHLVWQKNGRFSETCNRCVVSVNKKEPDTHRYLECYCKTKSGSWKEPKYLGFDMFEEINFEPAPEGRLGSFVCNNI